MIFIDLEGYSEAPLKLVGTHAYAQHHSTRILCVGWAIDDGKPGIILPGQPIPEPLARAWQDGVESTWAWNAQFERAVIEARWKWEFPGQPRPLRFQCSMALAASCGLPLSLEKCAAFLSPGDTSAQKDKRGKQLIRLLCMPNSSFTDMTRENKTKNLKELYDYCKQDIVAERAAHAKLPRKALPKAERDIWALDQDINFRGFMIDMPMVDGALDLLDCEGARQRRRIATLTHGAVGSPTETAKIKDWCGTQGVALGSLAKDFLEKRLTRPLPPRVRQVLELRQAGSRTSTGKYAKLKDTACPDHRIRGGHQYAAAHTLRWGGRGFQPQNLPKTKIDRSYLLGEIRTRDAVTLRAMAGDVSTVLRDTLRHVIIPSNGNALVVVDINAIEARVLGWIAGEKGYQTAYRDGLDLYKVTAAAVYGVHYADVTPTQRDFGKICVLALGYSMGFDTFLTNCVKNNIAVTPAMIQKAVTVYRSTYPAIPACWRGVESVFVESIQNPGMTLSYGPFLKCRTADGYAQIQLPSGRSMYYPRPRVQTEETKYGPRPVASYAQSTPAGMYRRSTYGGRLVENVVQAVSRDVLAFAMLRIDPMAPIVLHVHDEVVCDVETAKAPAALAEAIAWLSTAPAWAPGLRLKAAGFITPFYKK